MKALHAEMKTHIRFSVRRDIENMVAIEKNSQPAAWEKQDFINAMIEADNVGLVIENNEDVIGFVFYKLLGSRIHITNLAVHNQFQRKGIGSQLIKRVLSKVDGNRRNKLVLKVHEANLIAQLFLKSLNFKAIGIKHNHFGPGEDAYMMSIMVKLPEESKTK